MFLVFPALNLIVTRAISGITLEIFQNLDEFDEQVLYCRSPNRWARGPLVERFDAPQTHMRVFHGQIVSHVEFNAIGNAGKRRRHPGSVSFRTRLCGL